MKKKSILNSIALLALLAVPFLASAQAESGKSVNGVITQDLKLTVAGQALLKVVNTANGTNTDVSMSLSGAANAGEAILSTTQNSDTRLRITSQVDGDTKTRTITASISPSLLGTNTQLFVTLTKPNSFLPAVENGGTTAAEQELTSTAVNVVTGIKTCWSGTGATDGYTVTYRYAKVANATYVVSKNTTVTYTITEAV